MHKKLLLAALILISFDAFCQCTFNPFVTGDTLLCPNATGTLTTQVYDSYQWYKHEFGSPPAPIPGATSQTLNIDYFNDAGFYFSVEATDEACTETSPDVLVDGWVFLLPAVQTTGNFTVGPMGETIICQGDTAYFELLQPYDTNITWFVDGNVIPGAATPVLMITDSGSYTVQGAPSICPNFIQQLGVTLDVDVITCGVGLDEAFLSGLSIYPNPASDRLIISAVSNEPLQAAIYSSEGRKLMTVEFTGSRIIDITHLDAGSYFIRFNNENGRTFQSAFSVVR